MGGGVHLHTASGYSARYGASHPHALVARAAERGIGVLALTDRDTVTGVVRFAKAAAAAGIRPVFGVDLAVAPHAPGGPGPAGRGRTPVRGGTHVAEAPVRVTVLAQNASGWGRLCRIVSAAHTCAGGPPLASWEVLQQYADQDLTILLGPVSEPVRALTTGRPDIAQQLLAPWRDLASENLRLEAICWGIPGTGPGSVRLAAHTLALADRLRIRTILTNAVRYADPGQHRIADVLDAARLLRPVDRKRLDCGERWLKDPDAMAAVAEQVCAAAGAGPGRAAALLAETARTAAQCIVDPVDDLGLGTPHPPHTRRAGRDRTTAARTAGLHRAVRPRQDPPGPPCTPDRPEKAVPPSWLCNATRPSGWFVDRAAGRAAPGPGR